MLAARIVMTTAMALCLSLLSAGGASAVASRSDGLTGYAFDARCAPTQEQMDAWLTSSPFWGAGIYIGGSMMSCRPTATDPGQPQLDPTWVAQQRHNGWRLLPIWAGPQASCNTAYGDRIDPTPTGSYAAADARGRSEAAAAVARAGELGLPSSTTLWYDLEGGFDLADEDCRRSALRFLSGWTLGLHSLGYRSGVYSSISAGIHALDNADNLSPGSYAMPDQVWYAWYNGRADAEIGSQWVRPTTWASERVHQFEGQTTATYGGVSLVIDRNFVDIDGGSHAPREIQHCGGTRLDFGSYPRLKRGSSGDGVQAMQCLLRNEVHYRGRVDGRFDSDVVHAVKSFQRHQDLRVSGKGDGATWTALLSSGGGPLLKVGSTGESVLRLERALRATGARSVHTSGVLSDHTAWAVARYQARVGLEPSGVVTSETWTRLQQGVH